jgi:hypothetical protein
LVSAATLGLTQPAPGDAIRRLEARLAVRLLKRGPQGVAPTVAGDALALRARSALDRLAALAGDPAWRLTDPGLRAHGAIAEHGSLRAAGAWRRRGGAAPGRRRVRACGGRRAALPRAGARRAVLAAAHGRRPG